FEKGRRSVRSLGSDRPSFILEIHQRQQCLWYKLSNSRRTVRGTDLDTMEVGELVGEIRAHEMGILGMSEEPTTSKTIALKTNANKNRKLKMIKQESSSSNEEDDHHESSSDDED